MVNGRADGTYACRIQRNDLQMLAPAAGGVRDVIVVEVVGFHDATGSWLALPTSAKRFISASASSFDAKKLDMRHVGSLAR